jgi:hypothetical protein
MKSALRLQIPRARKERLLVEELDGEWLVYDLDCHKAHCLNLTAALIWRRCDGRTSMRGIARSIEKDSGLRVGEDLIRYGLEQLGKARLLVEDGARTSKVSRRDLIRKVGIAAAVALPLVTSIVAPRPVEAGSCVPLGATGCNTNRPCCSGVCAGGQCV